MSLQRTIHCANALAWLCVAACGDNGGGASATAGLPGITTANVTLTATAGDATAAPTSGGSPTAGGPESTTGAGTTGAAPNTTAEAPTATGPGAKFDLGDGVVTDGTTGAPGQTDGCTKIDFLFVVDNSGSMAGEQMNLITSFPGFIDTITQTLGAKDYHIMVVSTDDGKSTGKMSQCINGKCSCSPAPVCCQNACANGTTCNGFDCNNLPIGVCDTLYGTGKQYDASGKHCGLLDDRRYMLDTQPDVTAAFECIADVGTYGSGDEKAMHAAGEALSKPLNAPGGCNDGFLRDDAILVLTFITDEEDEHDKGKGSPGDPPDWYSAVVAAKNGDPESIVVLGLLGDSNLPNGVCAPGVDPNNNGNGAEAGPRLQQFTQMFPHGVIGSVCAADYTPFFVQAVGVIDTVCDQFDPPG